MAAFNGMQFPKENSKVSHGNSRLVSTEAAAAAALARIEQQAARKKEAKAKDERAREDAKKTEEEKIVSMKRAAAAVAETNIKKLVEKSAQAKEAARIAAEERAAVGHMKEMINATSNKSILEKSSVENINLCKYKETEMHGNSNEQVRERTARAKAQRAREAAKMEAEEKVEAKKRAAAEAGEALSKIESIKSEQVREAAKLAAEERAAQISRKSKNYNIDAASGPSQNTIPKKETFTVTEGQYYMKESCKGSTDHDKHWINEVYGNIKEDILTPTQASLKTAGQEKETVTVINANLTLMENSEKKVSHGRHNRTTIHSIHKGENSVHCTDEECKHEDYHVHQNGARRKERIIEHSKYANTSQYPNNDSLHNATTIEQKQRSRYGSEKALVLVTGEEKNRSNELMSARNEDQTSQYLELVKPPKMNDTDMEESKHEHSQEFQSEYYSCDDKAEVVPESHRHQGTHSHKTQHQFAPTKWDRGFDPSHQQYHSPSHHPNGKNHHYTQQDVQQRTPAHGSSRELICGSCRKKYNLKEKLPRKLYCKHSICTACIWERTNSILSVTCPHCPVKTWNVKDPQWCPVNKSLIKRLSEESHQDVFMEEFENSHLTLPSGNDRRQSHPQNENDSTKRSSIMQSMSRSKRLEHNTPKSSPHGSKCFEMGVGPSHYCSTCMVWICGKCAEAEHMISCFVEPLKDQISEMKQKCNLTGKSTQELLRKSLQSLENDCDQEKIFHLWIKAAFECMEKKQEKRKKALQEGREMINILTDVMEEMSKDQNLPAALAVFQIVEDTASEALKWSSSTELRAMDADEMTACLRSLMKRTLKLTQAENGISEIYATGKTSDGELFSELRADGEKFHIHALRKGKPNKHGARALPLQCFKSCQDATSMLVFLDLSWGGKSHGRLYIRLTGDTLRGRQFICLCTGEEGISFRGTPFHRVWWKGLPGEHVWTGDYENYDGSGGRIHSISSSQLQVPAGQETTIFAGLVAGRYEKENFSSIFRIYTRGEKEATDEAGFGQVEFGLDVVEEAIRLRNISEVMISECGLVLEM